jgi:hypothetical protein
MLQKGRVELESFVQVLALQKLTTGIEEKLFFVFDAAIKSKIDT